MKTLKKQFIILLSILFSITVLFTSCKSDENDNPPTEQGEFSENFGASVSRDFMGKIVDQSSTPIGGVNIKIGGETTTTDANGIFILNDVSVHERFAYVKAEKSGYLLGSRALVPTTGTNQVKIMLLNENIVGTVPSGSDGQVSLPNGTTVKFDGAFKDADGNAYSGNVTVMMQHLESSDTDIDKKMPGMLYAQNTDNKERLLETYGMINVELRGAGGEQLNIADGHKAIIELPIDASQNNAPSTIELWHFDQEKGYWIEDGSATKVGNKYVGEVAHFSWWNCDAQFPTVTLCLNIEDTNGDSIYGVTVQLIDTNNYSSYAVSDGDGNICGLIPANETLTMIVFDPCGSQTYTSSIGPFSSNTDIGTITVSTLTTSVVTGTLLDCNNNPVTDGYVRINYGVYDEIIYTVTNGSFVFTTASCNSLSNFTLEGVDYLGFQTTGVVNHIFNAPTTYIGNIIACNGVPEYITYQVNNDAPVFMLSNFNASLYLGGVSVGSQTGGNYFYMQGDSTTPGVYNSPNFDIGADIFGRDPGVPTNIQFVMSDFGAVGDYINITFSGTFTHFDGSVNNVSGTIRVKRDS